jgi:hypothetical protein
VHSGVLAFSDSIRLYVLLIRRFYFLALPLFSSSLSFPCQNLSPPSFFSSFPHSSITSLPPSFSLCRYGLTDIQEYYANTGALKKAAENNRGGRKVGEWEGFLTAFPALSHLYSIPSNLYSISVLFSCHSTHLNISRIFRFISLALSHRFLFPLFSFSSISYLVVSSHTPSHLLSLSFSTSPYYLLSLSLSVSPSILSPQA